MHIHRDFPVLRWAISVVPLMVILASACQPPQSASVEGLWLSRGYGLFMEVAEGGIDVREITAVSCIPREGPPSLVEVEPDGSWRLQVGDDPQGAFLGLDSESVARLKRTGTASDILFDRTDVPPTVCARPPENTPESNFDVFWTTYREHYPFFEMKGVDWDGVRDEVRPLVNDETTPEQLFALLGEAIAPLEDVHTSITAGSLGRVTFMRPDPELDDSASVMEVIATVEQKFSRAVEIIETRYLDSELRSFCKGHLRYGELPDGIAYVYLDQEGDYTDQPDFAAALEVLEAALDTIFTAAGEATGLILDVRKNYGGSDIFSLALASRLATREYTAYAKVARADPDIPDRWTAPQRRSVPTTTRPSFSGAVVQLTGRYTISAGETLTQALMGREPHITRIGEHTQGVFSDVLGRTLPNGWEFGLPNELFLTEDGRSFDGPGIPPDIEEPVFRDADLEAGRDPALVRAMAHIGAGGS